MGVSQRLQSILNLAAGSQTIADIGTDHAYLAIQAILQNICNRVIACDINQGPLKTAKKNIAAAGLTHAIETRLGNGLAPLLLGEADTIVLAGMGGTLMLNILQADIEKAKLADKIILAPQHDIPLVRTTLHQWGFDITAEEILAEDDKFYILIQTKYTGKVQTWEDKHYFLGKLFPHNNCHYKNYLQHMQNKINRYIHHINTQAEKETALTQLDFIQSELAK